MSIAFRFDSVKVNADGSIAVGYTYGTTPLDANPSGCGMSFNSRLDAVANKNAFIAHFDEDVMMKLAIAVYSIAAADPNLTGATALAGKTLTVDPTKPAAVMSYA